MSQQQEDDKTVPHVLNGHGEGIHNAEQALSEPSVDIQNAYQEQIESLKALVKVKEDRYLYLYADFDNYKKRSIKERSELIKFGWENVARELLGIADNLQRALLHLDDSMDKNLGEGLRMVFSHFMTTLERQGVKKIQALHQPFDPHLHEAVGKDFSDAAAGIIIKEQVYGYFLHDRLLRPAQVIVSQGLKISS